jgi:hypothetical protein
MTSVPSFQILDQIAQFLPGGECVKFLRSGNYQSLVLYPAVGLSDLS